MRALFSVVLVLSACKEEPAFKQAPAVQLEVLGGEDSFYVGDDVGFLAELAGDSESLVLQWRSDIDGLLDEQTVTSAEVEYVTSSLSLGSHVITLLVEDTASRSAVDTVTVEILERTAPTIQMVSPIAGAVGEEDTLFTFEAQISDLHDPSGALRVTFHSSVDGDLCTDVVPARTGLASCTDTPSVGEHDLVFSVTNTAGRTAEATGLFLVLPGDEVDGDLDGFTEDAGDCDDHNAGVYPDAPEYLNNVDDDCDGVIDNDTEASDDDHDGFTEIDGDCDDANPHTFPHAIESVNGLDNDCDGLIDNHTDAYDDDGDGYSELQGDCDDNQVTIYPGSIEIPYNDVDEDCDGGDLVDADGDGFAASFVTGGTDCNDTDAHISPAATEIPYNYVDEDCSGLDLVDVDGDGFLSSVVGGLDCYDDNPDVFPGQTHFFESDRGDGSFDYDCDLVEQRQGADAGDLLTEGECVLDHQVCSLVEGWLNSAGLQCGAVSDYLIECSMSCTIEPASSLEERSLACR